MPAAVLDAWALLAWLGGEPGGDVVDRWLMRAERQRDPLALSVINAGEVFYTLTKVGQAAAAEFARDLRRRTLPIQLASATNPRVWRAAELKARYPIAYADGFAAALAVELGISLLTGDPDFRPLMRDGVCTVEWIHS